MKSSKLKKTVKSVTGEPLLESTGTRYKVTYKVGEDAQESGEPENGKTDGSILLREMKKGEIGLILEEGYPGGRLVHRDYLDQRSIQFIDGSDAYTHMHARNDLRVHVLKRGDTITIL